MDDKKLILHIGDRKMSDKKLILHIYRIPGETTNEYVEENFRQNFVHLHDLENNETILFRSLTYKGEKLDTIKDEDKIVKIMEDITESLPEEERIEIGKALRGEE